MEHELRCTGHACELAELKSIWHAWKGFSHQQALCVTLVGVFRYVCVSSPKLTVDVRTQPESQVCREGGGRGAGETVLRCTG